MLVDEMIKQYCPNNPENNFKEAVKRIKEAMESGEKYVLLPKDSYKSEFSWTVTYETIDKLRDEGFDINKVWDPAEYWSVEWYDKIN